MFKRALLLLAVGMLPATFLHLHIGGKVAKYNMLSLCVQSFKFQALYVMKMCKFVFSF
jgi:hypothetical protein